MSNRRYDLPDWQRVLLCKLEIPIVVSRNTHHSARAIFHQHVVRHPDGDGLAAEWIDREHARVESFLLFLAYFATRRSLRPDFLRKGFDVRFQRRAFEQFS